jgi:molybdopterin converting factor small subunit
VYATLGQRKGAIVPAGARVFRYAKESCDFVVCLSLSLPTRGDAVALSPQTLRLTIARHRAETRFMVSIHLFAGVREAVGLGRVDADVAAPTPLAELLARVASDLPALGPWLARDDLLLAVNQEFRGRDHLIADGDEVALIPPVSGG